MTLFGNSVFTEAIKIKWGHTGLKWALIQWLVSLQEEKTETHRHTEGRPGKDKHRKRAGWGWRQRIDWWSYMPRNVKHGQQWPYAGDPPCKPLEGAPCCKHLDFRLLASRTTRECISAIVSHPVWGSPRNLLYSPFPVLLTQSSWDGAGHLSALHRHFMWAWRSAVSSMKVENFVLFTTYIPSG